MTVKELIDALYRFDPDMPVRIVDTDYHSAFDWRSVLVPPRVSKDYNNNLDGEVDYGQTIVKPEAPFVRLNR